MIPVFVIEVKVRLCVDRANLFHHRNDEAEVLEDGLIVCTKYASTLSLVVTPGGKNIGGELIIRIVENISNEG